MLNKYPLWKYLLVAAYRPAGALFALPNLFAPDPALQITGASSGQMIDGDILARAENALEAADIDFFGEVVDDNGRNALLRLRERDAQLRAQAVVSRALGDGFIVALNLAETTPGWLTAIGAQPMKLGLDLSGGVHFKLEVDVDAAVERRMEYYLNATKRGLREARVRGFVGLEGERALVGRFRSESLREQARDIIADLHPELVLDRVEEGDDWLVYARMSSRPSTRSSITP
jgi:preprotein translocase subunit SecD